VAAFWQIYCHSLTSVGEPQNTAKITDFLGSRAGGAPICRRKILE
jgi:hypothetical protein